MAWVGWLLLAGSVSAQTSRITSAAAASSGHSYAVQTLEDSLLFHPMAASEQWLPTPAGVMVQDVWLQARDGTRIHAWWFASPRSSGALLFCHGNAGNLSHRTQSVLALMHALGESVLIFDYPGYGRSEGKPSETGCYAAADAAYDWLTQVAQIPPERILLFGESLGGGVATDLASRRPERALILIKTFTSVPDVARAHTLSSASAPLVHNQFDNLEKIGKCHCPVFIAHGDRDHLVPFAEGQKLYKAAPFPKGFFVMKGCDHNDPLPAELLKALASFLSRVPVRNEPIPLQLR
jgi:fermentation-respiration switch protein FrsA (DUF1100 family)